MSRGGIDILKASSGNKFICLVPQVLDNSIKQHSTPSTINLTMPVTEIIRFESSPSIEDDAIREAIETLRESKRARHENLGVEVQQPNAVQITAEWDEDHQVHPGSSSITDSVKPYLGTPRSVFHVTFNQPAFGPDGAATSSVIEFAANYFPVSRLTPEYMRKIHDDFLEFDRICKEGLKGSGGMSYGWVHEEQDHPSVKDEMVKCFLITRGWESFEHFQRSTETEAVKKALPILFAWNAPHEIVRVSNETALVAEG